MEGQHNDIDTFVSLIYHKQKSWTSPPLNVDMPIIALHWRVENKNMKDLVEIVYTKYSNANFD